MTRRHSVLIFSLVAILLALMVIVGVTYALFSDSVKISNHIDAGTLKITLVRESLTGSALANDGTLETVTDNNVKDFTKSEDNVFNLKTGDLVVPKSTYTANMKITNNGSVAFGYWVEIKINGATPTGKDLALAQQLKVTVTPNGGSAQSSYVDKGLYVGSQAAPVATVLKNASATFSVTVLFDDLAANNSAELGSLTFDLVVHAIQVTSK